MSPFRKFLKQFSHFFSGMIIAQLFALISFPILTRVLTKEQYGIAGLVSTTMFFAVAIAKAGLSDGVVRFYKEYSTDKSRQEIFSSTVLVRGMVLSFLTSLLYVILLLIVKKYLKIDEKYAICFLIMLFYLLIRPLNIIVLYFLRVNDKTIFINIVNLIDRIGSVGLSLLFLLFIIKDFYGYFIGLVTAEIIISTFLFYWFFKHYRLNPTKVSKELNLKLIKFGVPILLSELSFLLTAYADRYIIAAYLGKENLGLYTVGYNLAMYIGNLVTLPISYAMVPIYVEIYVAEGRENTEAFLKKCLQYLLMIITPMWFGYAAISKDLFITLASEKYAISAKFSPLILLAYFFGAINILFNAGLYLKKKTMVSFIIGLTGIILSIGMNLLLLPRFGITAGAVSAAASFMLSTILTMVISRKYITVRIELKTLFYYIGVSVFMYIVVREIETPWTWMNLVLKIIVGILVVALGVIYKEYKNLKDIKNWYKSEKA